MILMMSNFFFLLVSNGHISFHLFRSKVRIDLAAKTASFKDCGWPWHPAAPCLLSLHISISSKLGWSTPKAERVSFSHFSSFLAVHLFTAAVWYGTTFTCRFPVCWSAPAAKIQICSWRFYSCCCPPSSSETKWDHIWHILDIYCRECRRFPLLELHVDPWLVAWLWWYNRTWLIWRHLESLENVSFT